MKQKFIEWFTKGNNGCAPSINADGSFEHEKTQHMFEAYQAGMAESERKVEQLAAENAGLKSAFDKPDAWLSWHSIPPTFYEPDRGGEYLQVHEKAGEKNDDGSDSWPVYRKPETETPSTDAILAEVRASGVEQLASLAGNECQRYKSVGDRAGVRKWKSIVILCTDFAAQLRQEAK